MDLEMFAKKIQVSGILSKYDVSIKEAKIIGAVIEELEQQCKKQKEVIDKAIKYTEKFIPIDEDTILMRERQRDYLLDILKEVSE